MQFRCESRHQRQQRGPFIDSLIDRIESHRAVILANDSGKPTALPLVSTQVFV
jgi:hypothetical protein